MSRHWFKASLTSNTFMSIEVKVLRDTPVDSQGWAIEFVCGDGIFSEIPY